MIDSEFEGLQQVAADSRLGRAAVGVARAVTSAWDSSSLVSRLGSATARVASVPIARRVRLGALALVWAGLGHLAILVVVPAYVAPGLPRPWIVIAMVAALVVAGSSGAWAQAWPESRVRRAFQKKEP